MIGLRTRSMFVRGCRHNVYFRTYIDADNFMAYYGLSYSQYDIYSMLLMLKNGQILKFTQVPDLRF
jgi:hypothetical protein